MSKVLIEQIKGALSTDEDGANLIEVARNSHRAELELARLKRWANNGDVKKILRHLGIMK